MKPNESTPRAKAVTLACCLLTLAACCGCAGRKTQDRKPTVCVQGTVLVAGKPAAGAIVSFQRRGGPDPTSPGAQGVVDDQGGYELTTYETKDGVIAGEYAVGVMWPSRPDWWNSDEPPEKIDRLKGRYTADKSQIVRTIDESTTTVEPIEIE